jgi:hypothetical protein
MEQAQEREAAIEQAIEARQPTEGLVWMEIERTKSVAITNRQGVFELDEYGQLMYGPDEQGWQRLHSADLPSWVTEPEAIGDLKKGTRLCMAPSEGGRWYRGKICTPPGTPEEKH